jgi:hypothetical protein
MIFTNTISINCEPGWARLERYENAKGVASRGNAVSELGRSRCPATGGALKVPERVPITLKVCPQVQKIPSRSRTEFFGRTKGCFSIDRSSAVVHVSRNPPCTYKGRTGFRHHSASDCDPSTDPTCCSIITSRSSEMTSSMPSKQRKCVSTSLMLSLSVMFFAHQLQPALVCRSVRLEMRRNKKAQVNDVEAFFRHLHVKSEGTFKECKFWLPAKHVYSPETIQYIACLHEKAASLGFLSAVHEGYLIWWTK